MDYLSRCYRARLRPFSDSDAEVLIRWYFCGPGAQVFPGQHLFGSQVWREIADDPPDGPGELYGPKNYDPGYNPGYVGQCHVGPDEWYRSGVPVGAVTGSPPVLPTCCFVLEPAGAGGRGGWRGLGRSFPPPRVGARGGWRGQVVIGDELGELGGWSGFSVAPAPVGGLGGWSGIVVVSGGLGGLGGWSGVGGAVQVGRWGLLGGVREIAMSLLYCSVRQTGVQVIPPTTQTLLSWDTVEYDPSGFYSSLNPTRLTVPADGVYVIQVQTMWNSALAGGFIGGDLFLNNSQDQTLFGDEATFPDNNVRGGVALLKLFAGDFLGVGIFQRTPGGIAPDTAGFYAPSFRIASLGVPNGPAYFASSVAPAAVTDGASFYDLPGLAIANVPPGLYLAVVSFCGSNKSGEVRVIVTDGSGAINYWPATTPDYTSRHNVDNFIEFNMSGVIQVTSVGTVKVRAAASIAIGNYTIAARHLTLTRVG